MRIFALISFFVLAALIPVCFSAGSENNPPAFNGTNFAGPPVSTAENPQESFPSGEVVANPVSNNAAVSLKIQPDIVPTLEQIQATIIRAIPNAVTDTSVYYDDPRWSLSLIENPSITPLHSQTGAISGYMIGFSLGQRCNHCARHGVVITDAGLNTISAVTEDTKGEAELEFIELECKDGRAACFKVHEIGAMATGVESLLIYGAINNAASKLFDNELSLTPPDNTYTGEKIAFQSSISFGKCKSGPKDIYITKEFSQYDDYQSGGKMVREYLRNDWSVKEKWVFNGSKYVLRYRAGFDPIHASALDKFVDRLIHRKKSRFKPGTGMKG